MLVSGTKSYYDNFIRKQGKERGLNDAPSLLTDRGAYVNFLEVQLERVSAACLGVQSYDQRFNDMQALLVSLEERCGSATRLIAISQQCTEELRKNVFEEIEKAETIREKENSKVHGMIQNVCNKVNNIENYLSSISQLASRVNMLEREVHKTSTKLDSVEETGKTNFAELNKDLLSLADVDEKHSVKIEGLQTQLNKQTIDISEMDRLQGAALLSLETKLQDANEVDRDEALRKEKIAETKLSFEVGKLNETIDSREVKVLSAMRTDLKTAQNEFTDTKSSLEKNVSKSMENLSKECYDNISAVSTSFKVELENVNKYLQAANAHYVSLEDTIQRQSAGFSDGMKSLSSVQLEVTDAISQLREEMLLYQAPPSMESIRQGRGMSSPKNRNGGHLGGERKASGSPRRIQIQYPVKTTQRNPPAVPIQTPNISNVATSEVNAQQAQNIPINPPSVVNPGGSAAVETVTPNIVDTVKPVDPMFDDVNMQNAFQQFLSNYVKDSSTAGVEVSAVDDKENLIPTQPKGAAGVDVAKDVKVDVGVGSTSSAVHVPVATVRSAEDSIAPPVELSAQTPLLYSNIREYMPLPTPSNCLPSTASKEQLLQSPGGTCVQDAHTGIVVTEQDNEILRRNRYLAPYYARFPALAPWIPTSNTSTRVTSPKKTFPVSPARSGSCRRSPPRAPPGYALSSSSDPAPFFPVPKTPSHAGNASSASTKSDTMSSTSYHTGDFYQSHAAQIIQPVQHLFGAAARPANT